MRDSNKNSNDSTNNSLNDSSKGSPLLSPKLNKIDPKEEDSRQYLMKKRSPTKMYEDKDTPGVNTSINYKG